MLAQAPLASTRLRGRPTISDHSVPSTASVPYKALEGLTHPNRGHHTDQGVGANRGHHTDHGVGVNRGHLGVNMGPWGNFALQKAPPKAIWNPSKPSRALLAPQGPLRT